jgi:hypothetical protein
VLEAATTTESPKSNDPWTAYLQAVRGGPVADVIDRDDVDSEATGEDQTNG